MRPGLAVHRRNRPAAAVTQAPPASAWRAAVNLFTVIPAPVAGEIRKDAAARAVLWLPVVGLLIGAVAAGVLFGAEAGGDSAARRLLAAALALAVLGLLTGGLHLDGLADTADGLGSRRPGDQALAVMRRSDVGPMGVTALLFVVLLQSAALAALPARWPGAAALVLAVVTGRVAVVIAAGTGTPSARPDGFGALVAATATARARLVITSCLLAVVAAGGAAAGGAALAARGLGAVLAGLLAAELIRGAARRRLGGMTGDVFGAVIEVSTATVLLVLALST
jgi:adenosylcobinamide-GDP ribazoletransferase